ncbi:protein translocase subunit SecD [Sphingomonas sp. G-3-2-10]|uniref:protein translocase subunit SecD n=1 Tax=Sphingomonas sp. G-3-2-10 TaxID=2728838 RepID=UPI00146A06AC|nr:protein translocase subunit SecD [Sphingomonas sp. G-3-2-10]NML06192.1 protein translocase subunit SecD [Sphingomonas sp. G-3-2-10]
MLDFPRWKVWATILTIVASFLLAIPSLLPEKVYESLPGWLPKPTVSLGLDLAGGSYLLLEADTKGVAASKLEQMSDQVLTEMRRGTRIEIGPREIKDGSLTFMVDDPTKVDAVRERLLTITGSGAGMTGQRVWDIQVVDSSRFVLTPTKAGLDETIATAMGDAREVVEKRINGLGTREPTIVLQGKNRIVVQVPGLKNPEQLKRLIGETAKLEFKLVNDTANPTDVARDVAPPGSQVLPYAEGGGKIAVYSPVSLSGDQLVNATMEFGQQDGKPGVSIQFDGAGTKRFAKLSTDNVRKQFAIIVDGVVISAPVFEEPILGGQARISGNFTPDSATQLAIALRSGKLPIALKVVEERTVSAELGTESIEKGVLAGVVGSLALIVFMLVTYMRFGVYTAAALLVNAVMVVAGMALFNASLTLPGIAGFVLTIGAAVDANVLINERIREEQRMRNRAALASVEFGYKEASRAIFDANVTNVISAVIMFTFGSGPVRGFAVVLAIGIVTSVFTGVTFTRLLVADWLKRNRPKTINI